MKPAVGIKSAKLGMLELRYKTGVPEMKFVDTSASTTITSSAGPPIPTTLNLCVQGTGPYNRIGQRIQMMSLRITGYVWPNATTTAYSAGRIIVVYDRQANAALPVWTDLIANVTQAGSVNTGVYGNLNLANRERFIILADERYNFSPSTATGSATSAVTATEKNPVMANFDRFIKLRGLEAHFNQTNGGTYADIQTGSITIFLVGDATSGGNFTFTYWTRLRYQDL